MAIDTVYKKSGPQVTIGAGDIQIGAVELKDATAATRAKIAATGSVAEGDAVLGVQAPVLGTTADAAVTTDAAGTISAKLRGFVALLAALARGTGTSDANTLRVVLSDDSEAGAPQIAIDWTEAPEEVSVSNATATSGQLAVGTYVVSCTCDVYIKRGGAAVTAAVTDRKLFAGDTELLNVTGTDDDYVAAITDAATGTLQIQLTETI